MQGENKIAIMILNNFGTIFSITLERFYGMLDLRNIASLI